MLDLLGTIDAAELATGQLVVSAHGPLDERIATTLRDTLLPLAAADDIQLVLDLEDAHGLDDATLGVISHAALVIRRRGESLAIVTRSPFVTSLVVDCGLGDIVTLYSCLREAIVE